MHWRGSHQQESTGFVVFLELIKQAQQLVGAIDAFFEILAAGMMGLVDDHQVPRTRREYLAAAVVALSQLAASQEQIAGIPGISHLVPGVAIGAAIKLVVHIQEFASVVAWDHQVEFFV